MEAGIDGLARIIPQVRQFIAPLINVANEKQIDNGDINLKETGSYQDGLWQSSISVNARTNEFHTENDSTYTVITIPKQEANEKAEADYSFFFKVQDKENVSIKLTEGLTFLFSG